MEIERRPKSIMTTMHDPMEVKQLPVLASAEITAGMAEDLARMCVHARTGERVIVQISDQGVWGVTSRGIRMFIGKS